LCLCGEYLFGQERMMFVAVGHNGARIASPDGREWKFAQAGKEGEVYRCVAAGDGRVVAVGSYGGSIIFAASTDGQSWKTGTRDGKYTYYFRGLTFGPGGFLALGGDPGAVGASRPFICRSTDGMTWGDYINIAGVNMIRRAAWSKELCVGVGDRGRRAFSRDGQKWEDVPGVKAKDTLIDVAYGASLFVGVGLHGLRMSTTDGKVWSDPQRGEEGEHLNSVLWAEDRFVAIGAGATYISPDGKEWKRHANTDAPLTATYGKGVFVGASWKGRLLVSRDGIAWEQVHKHEHHLEAVAYLPG
jgi:hypothetical protein